MKRMAAAGALGTLCARSIFSGKRFALTAVLFGLPPLVALFIGGTARAGLDPAWAMNFLSLKMILPIYILLIALVHGLSLSSGEIEDGTAVYAFLGLLPRWVVLLVRFFVTAVLLSALTFGTLALTGLAIAATSGGSAGPLLALAARYGLVASVGLACYLAFFLFCGYAFPRPAAVGIITTILWEFVVTFTMPMKFAAYTLTNNLYGLALSLALDGDQGRWFRYRRAAYEMPTYESASLFVSVALGLFLVASMIALMNRSIEGKEAK